MNIVQNKSENKVKQKENIMLKGVRIPRTKMVKLFFISNFMFQIFKIAHKVLYN